MPNVPTIKITRAWRRTMTLHVMPGGTILVKAPYFVPVGDIHAFVDHHQTWVRKKLAHVRQSSQTARRKYIQGEKFLFLGKHYTFTIGNYSNIELRDEKLLFPEILLFRVKKEIETWYMREARRIIRAQAEWYAQRMQVHYISITFSDTTSKWGSCTHDNKLQFNWRLILAPMTIVNYLVVHELTHILEKNHSKRFWGKVAIMHPTYKTDSKWLKTHGDSLTIDHRPITITSD